MSPRNTKTGQVMEQMVLPALRMGGYTFKEQAYVGLRLDVARHRVDVLAEDPDGRSYLISLKWQQVGGTAENKIPFEVISLAHARVENERFYKAYLVLGGNGWRYKDFYLSGGLDKHLRNPELVDIVSLEAFVALANQGRL